MEGLLKDEKYFVKYVPDYSNGIMDKTHPEHGGMSNNASLGICAPLMERKIPLLFSKEELEFLAQEIGNEEVKNPNSDFWREFSLDEYGMTKSAFPIFLKKEGMMLNKIHAMDYIHIKILQDSNLVASSVAEAKQMKAKFVILKEADKFIAETANRKDTKTAFSLYYKYEENAKVLRYLLVTVGKSLANNASKDFIQNEAWAVMNKNQAQFVKILGDELLDVKVDITLFLRYKLISVAKGLYYDESGSKISMDNEVNDITGAAKFLNSGAGQEMYLSLKAKLQVMAGQKPTVKKVEKTEE